MSGKRRLAVSRNIFAVLVGFGASLCAWADSSTATVSGASINANDTPTTLKFPVVRTGDTSYDAYLSYQTKDGSAVAGTDYSATTGVLRIPAGARSATIPVTIAANTGDGASKSFQLQLLGAAGIGPAASFANGVDLGLVDQPYAVATGDFNGDGAPDLVVTNIENNNISILLNTTPAGASTPSFGPRVDISTGSNPAQVLVADFNGDGKPDIAVAFNSFSGLVTIFTNTTPEGSATPTFSSQTFVTSNTPGELAVADFNGDGKPDLAVANAAGGSAGDYFISLMLNSTAPGAASPSFTVVSGPDLGNGNQPSSVAVADFNGDGKPDLVVAVITSNSTSGPVQVFLNTSTPGSGTISFTASQPFNAGANATLITVADFNGDGRPDMAITNPNPNFTAGTVSLLINATGTGSSTANFDFAASVNVGSVEGIISGDFNGDGRPDIAVTASDAAQVLINTTPAGATTPSFAPLVSSPVGNSPFNLASADFNGDGKPDLVAVNFYSNSATVLLNTGTAPRSVPKFALAASPTAGNSPGGIGAADFNGDGKPDLAVANVNSGTVSVFFNGTAPGAAAGTFTASGGTPLTVGHYGPGPLAIGDFNNDGKPDIAVADFTGNVDPGFVSVFINATTPGSANANFTLSAEPTVDGAPGGIATGDLNGDGNLDLVLTSAANRAGDNATRVSVLLGKGDGTFQAQQEIVVGTGLSVQGVAVADVDGDGRPDILVANGLDAGDDLYVLLNTTAPGSTTMSFAAPVHFATGIHSNLVAVGDFNGDGKPDIAVAGINEGTGNGEVVTLINTTTVSGGVPAFNLGAPSSTGTGGGNPQGMVLKDFDGDGRLDIAVSNYAANTIGVLYNGTAAGAASASFALSPTIYATGTDPLQLTAADFNGDGRPDLATANFGGTTATVLFNTQYQVAAAGSPATGTIAFVAPAAPSNLAVTSNGGGQIALSWTATPGVSGYYVFTGTASGAETGKSALLSGTSTTFSGLRGDTTYYFIVRAYNQSSGTYSAASNEVSAMAIPPPAAPASLSAEGGNGKITLRWATSAGASDYRVYESTTSGGAGTLIGGSPDPLKVVSGLSSNSKLYFTVRAFNGSHSATSPEASATTAPDAPANVTATAGSGKATLRWTAAPGATAYRIYVSASSSVAGTLIGGLSGTSKTISGLTSGTEYFFTVRSYNGSDGAASPAVGVTPN